MSAAPLDATQALGIAAFTLAALACLWAARARGPGWLGLAAAQGLAAAEIAIGWRYRLHDVAAALLRSEGAYEGRAPWQMALVIATLAASVWALIAIARRGRSGPGWAGALAGTAVTAAIFLIETVSLHGVDALMYASAGPVKFIGWLWLASAVITAVSALRARRGWMSPSGSLKPPSPTGPRR